MKTKILTILSNSDGYVSGQQLCEQLGVSRTAVWKVINRLKEEGYLIDSVSNKGYRLLSQPDVVTSEAILSKLQTNYMGRQVFSYDEVTSTNTVAKQLADEGKEEGTLIVSDKQIQGKGRRGRYWESPKGSGIFMTVILKPMMKPVYASMLTLVAALALNDAITDLTGLEAKIKWPNDVVVNKKKVAGILTELSAEVDYINHIVVGIGVNVSMKDFPEELKDKATSLLLESGKSIGRAQLIAKTMEYLECYYERFLKTHDLSELKETYSKVLINKDQVLRTILIQELLEELPTKDI